MGSLIYILSTRVDFCFQVHKLKSFSSNTDKVNFEGLVLLLRYNRDKNNLVLRYYSKIDNTPLYELLRQASVKTHNQFMVLSNSSRKGFQYNGIITGAYIVFYQGRPIDHCTHVPGPVSQSSAESQYNA